MYEGGYTPQGYSWDEARKLAHEDEKKYREVVHKSLRQHYELIEKLSESGARFWDYGSEFFFLFELNCFYNN